MHYDYLATIDLDSIKACYVRIMNKIKVGRMPQIKEETKEIINDFRNSNFQN